MPDLQTGKKESPTPDSFEDNLTTSDCQENTLVSDNAIFENKNHFEVYPHCIVYKKAFKKTSSYHPEQRKRGKISNFSKRARFRLFFLLAKINNKLDFPPIFVTLTYHYGHLNTEKTTKEHLHNFLVQLRYIDPDVQFIWRIELQKRGAPHYHFIIFPSVYRGPNKNITYSLAVARLWHSIADPNSLKHKDFGCLIKNIKNYREACMYLSKYIAKVPDGQSDIEEGKHWGNSRKLPVKCKIIYGAFDEDAAHCILKIRGWLIKNGRAKYASPEFLNVHTDFVVFVDFKDTPDFFDDELYFRIPPNS